VQASGVCVIDTAVRNNVEMDGLTDRQTDKGWKIGLKPSFFK